MAIDNFELLHEDALASLTRPELQTLAKAHDIKANIKSTNIIAQLLKKFPDGVPSPKTDAKPLPSKKGRIQKGGPRKNAQIKQEESAVESSMLSTVSIGRSMPEQSQESHSQPSAAANEPDGRRSTRYGSRAQPVVNEVSASSTSLSRDIVPHLPLRLSEQPLEESPTPEILQDVTAHENAAGIPTMDEDEHDDVDALSEISEYTHAPSESSADSDSDPPANDATMQYVVDIIRANAAEDEKLRDTIQRLRERASATKALLQQQYQILHGEREQRERIIKFLLYHIQNNNRWKADGLDPKSVSAQVYEFWVTNGGRGYKDMGEWEFHELYSGPVTLKPNNLEVSHSDEEEYLRGLQEAEEARLLAHANAASTSGARPYSHAQGAKVVPAKPTEVLEASSRKRKASTMIPPTSESTLLEKRPRHTQPLIEDSAALGTSSLAMIPPQDKGKRKMSSVQVEQLEQEQAWQKRIQRMGELEEDDSAEAAYQVQVALANSLLESAESAVAN